MNEKDAHAEEDASPSRTLPPDSDDILQKEERVDKEGEESGCVKFLRVRMKEMRMNRYFT